MSRAKLPAETAIKPCVAAADEYTHYGHLTASVARKSNKTLPTASASPERSRCRYGGSPTTTPPRQTSTAALSAAWPRLKPTGPDARLAAFAPVTVQIELVLQERCSRNALDRQWHFH
jgi:hypothetical protein